MRVALSGLTMAEYFRDQEHKDVLLFIDNIFRFVQAGSEVSTLLGRMPSAVGYQPTLATEMGALQERIASTKSGSVTSVQAVYVPADDLTDPAPATTFTHLDATTVLSRKIAEQGIYPGGGSAGVHLPHSGGGHRGRGALPRLRAACRRSCRSTTNCRTSSPSSAWTNSATRTSMIVLPRASKMQRFLSQPFHVAEKFTGMPGRYVPLRGDHPRLPAPSWTARWTIIPEAAFFNVGGIDEVREKAEKLKEE